IGFGLGMVCAPLLILIDPRLVPGPLLMNAMVLTVFIVVRERRGLHLKGLQWALSGRLLGIFVAVFALRVLSLEGLSYAVGVVVLFTVLLSVSGLRLMPNPWSLLGAGTLSGIGGTISSIGGPPMALVYQHSEGSRIRGTLAGYFVIGTMMSLSGLGVAGKLGFLQLNLAVLLLPGIFVGFALSSRVAPWLDKGYARPMALGLSALASVLVILRTYLASS
ncbi:MAG: sulfite exporter TauE/SafE family protein, partial [Gemmatimonadota bacterium]|nr:sulfite exporter TauE/SafE family protein [Gemmatimonadota bacterium]